jgi:hypothetical protein
LLSLQSELAILIGHLTRIWLLALTARILLLLAGLLSAALLLLAGLLARFLVLLTRVLILSGHSEISLFRLSQIQRLRGSLVARGTPVPPRPFDGGPLLRRWRTGTRPKMTLVQDL